ncbi:MAG: porphobilinogen synthase [Paracoccaceae bacterium]|nr:porphobilinogen synthase [Paracoccaceae bacterium]
MSQIITPYPIRRSRRLRRTEWIRDMVAENKISISDLIWPVFICDGLDRKEAIKSLPGIYRYSIDKVTEIAQDAVDLGINCIALFPYTPKHLKTPDCAEAWNPDNLVNRATRAIKKITPNLGIILDVALDPYNSDGHDGLIRGLEILNDETLIALEKQALAQANSGADILGPSDMMDGRVGVIRRALEANGLKDTLIMSYSAKFSSSFYGPFRDAVGASGSLSGDKKTYQIDCANSREAIRDAALDISEGADMVMVKPGLPYLDVCKAIKLELNVPTFAYQVSGEYAMIESASLNGFINKDLIMLETLLSFKRAGCDGVLTYFAPELAKLLTRK